MVASGGDARKLPSVGAGARPAGRYLIPISYLILNLYVEIGEGRAIRAYVLLEPFGALNILGHGRVVVYVVWSDVLVCYVEVPVIEHLFNHVAGKRLILFCRRHRVYSFPKQPLMSCSYCDNSHKHQSCQGAGFRE